MFLLRTSVKIYILPRLISFSDFPSHKLLSPTIHPTLWFGFWRQKYADWTTLIYVNKAERNTPLSYLQKMRQVTKRITRQEHMKMAVPPMKPRTRRRENPCMHAGFATKAIKYSFIQFDWLKYENVFSLANKKSFS